MEEQETIAVVNKYETQVEITGSRAEGKGRNLNTNLPKGKSKLATRSDIDFRIDAAHPHVDEFISDLKSVGGGVGSAGTKWSLQARPSWPPYFSISPTGVMYVGPNYGAGGITGVVVNAPDERD